jgi:hypothetical protein
MAAVNLPPPLRDFHEGGGVRTAEGSASVRVGRGLAWVLLRFVGIGMREGRQGLVVTFEPDGQGELWRRTFESGGFTSRFEVDAAERAVVELFGPFSLHYGLTVGTDDITWTLRRARFFGVPIPTALAPRVAAREWISPAGGYEMSAEITMPLLGHVLSYTSTLARVPPYGMSAAPSPNAA